MGWLTNFFTSSIGRKVVMALTGLFLISFLLVHGAINALLFKDDGGLLFNEASLFMETNIVIRILEVVLFAGFIIHILQSLVITLKNRKTRPVNYEVFDRNANSKWYSRSMGILGSLILVFLVIHLRNFFIETHFTDNLGFDQNGNPDLYAVVKEAFEAPIYVAFYLISMAVLAYHLLHGFQSAFRSLGLKYKKYTPAIEWTGLVFSIGISVLFAAMPLFFILKKMFS